MRGFGLQIIGPMVLAAIGGSLFLTLDYTTRSQATPGGLTVGAYASDLPRRAMIGLQDIKASTAPASRVTIADYVPPAPEGWTVRDLVETDREDLTGIAPRTPTPEEQEMQEALDSSLVGRLVQANVTRGFKAIGGRYDSPTGTTLLHLRFIPARVFNGMGGLQLGMMQDMMELENALEAQPFATLGGVDFAAKPMKKAPHVRDISGGIGRQVRIDILTTDTDEAVLALLSQLDIDGMNALLAEPVEGIGGETLVVAEAAAPMDVQGFVIDAAAPEPSVAPAVAPAQGGGFSFAGAVGGIAGLFGGGDAPASDTDDDVTAALQGAATEDTASPAPVKVLRLGGGGTTLGNGCSIEGGVKRCTIGSD